jgi:3D (Asp-Asp-Asp) domain-containing protein
MEKVITCFRVFILIAGIFWLIDTFGEPLETKRETKMATVQGTTTTVPEPKEEKLGKSHKVTATYYNPVPEQCEGDPLLTASGRRIDLEKLKREEIKWIAVSRDLLKTYKYGDVVRLTCADDPSIDGDYVIADTMHERWENKIDLLWHVDKKGKGKWENVQIAKLN